jgi:hypothetical protein
MSWNNCPLVVQNKRGEYVIKDTDIWVRDIVRLRSNGSLWLAKAFQIPPELAEQVIRYYEENSDTIGRSA